MRGLNFLTIHEMIRVIPGPYGVDHKHILPFGQVFCPYSLVGPCIKDPTTYDNMKCRSSDYGLGCFGYSL